MENTTLLSQLSRVMDVALQECGFDSIQLSVVEVGGVTQLQVSSDGYAATAYVDDELNVQLDVSGNTNGFRRRECTVENLIDTLMELKSQR